MTDFEDWKVFLQQFDKLENQYNNVYHLLQVRNNQYKELQVENKGLQKVVEEKGLLLVRMEGYWKEQFETVVSQRDQADHQRGIWRRSSVHWYKVSEELHENGLKRISKNAFLYLGLYFSLMANLGCVVGFLTWWYCS